MLSLTKHSKLKPEEILKKTKDFFGPRGYGLELKEEDADHIYLEGGGGGVNVIVTTAEKGTNVDLETREWESQSKDFMASIK